MRELVDKRSQEERCEYDYILGASHRSMEWAVWCDRHEEQQHHSYHAYRHLGAPPPSIAHCSDNEWDASEQGAGIEERQLD